MLVSQGRGLRSVYVAYFCQFSSECVWALWNAGRVLVLSRWFRVRGYLQATLKECRKALASHNTGLHARATAHRARTFLWAKQPVLGTTLDLSQYFFWKNQIRYRLQIRTVSTDTTLDLSQPFSGIFENASRITGKFPNRSY